MEVHKTGQDQSALDIDKTVADSSRYCRGQDVDDHAGVDNDGAVGEKQILSIGDNSPAYCKDGIRILFHCVATSGDSKPLHFPEHLLKLPLLV